jgi:hypothetical protein
MLEEMARADPSTTVILSVHYGLVLKPLPGCRFDREMRRWTFALLKNTNCSAAWCASSR